MDICSFRKSIAKWPYVGIIKVLSGDKWVKVVMKGAKRADVDWPVPAQSGYQRQNDYARKAPGVVGGEVHPHLRPG